jgi:flagella basal body P-ring formation protein FlgA
MRLTNILRSTILTSLIFTLMPVTVLASDVVTGADIKAAILSELAQHNITSDPQVSERRRYYRCSSHLQVTPKFNDSWETARVACPDKGRDWHIIVRTGQVSPKGAGAPDKTGQTGAEVVVLLASVKKGAVITEDIVALTKLSSGQRIGGFFRPEDVIGRRAKQNLSAMQPLKARHLEHQWSLEVGQPVNIVQKVGGFEVSSVGEVLENAQIGDIIEVINTRSGRKISALVENSKKVTPIANIN